MCERGGRGGVGEGLRKSRTCFEFHDFSSNWVFLSSRECKHNHTNIPKETNGQRRGGELSWKDRGTGKFHFIYLYLHNLTREKRSIYMQMSNKL